MHHLHPSCFQGRSYSQHGAVMLCSNPAILQYVPAPHSSYLQLSLVVFILPGKEVDLLQQLLLVMLQLTHGDEPSHHLLLALLARSCFCSCLCCSHCCALAAAVAVAVAAEGLVVSRPHSSWLGKGPQPLPEWCFKLLSAADAAGAAVGLQKEFC